MIVADEILGHRLAALHEDVSEMKTALRQLTSAVNKLALVEQQQGQMAKSMERAFAAIEKVDARVAEIEKRLPEVTRTSVWVDRAVWGAVAAAGALALKKIGL